MSSSFAVRSRRVVTPEGVRDAAVVVKDGIFAQVASPEEVSEKISWIDIGSRVVMPGLVDTHVHINDPGRSDWEGFETGTRAASVGGITTVVDMPLNCVPVTTTARALEAKLQAAQKRISVDCGFWGGLIPGNSGELEALIDAGVFGFKAFLIDSGIDDFPNVTEADLRQAMPILARRGVPLLVHAELNGDGTTRGADPCVYKNYLESRPKAWENKAIDLMIRLCREYGCRVHIVHLSSAGALDSIQKAKQEGLPLTAETCPHYLALNAEDVPDGRTEFKCAPPIREKENRERLWGALRAGVIDFIVSDHSPCLPELKHLDSGDFRRAWGGIASLQLTLPIVWTEAKRRGFALADVARWMSSGPADFAGLGKTKGRIAPGYDADILVWDPEVNFVVKPETIYHKHKVTPYSGRTLEGVVGMTFLGGRRIYEKGAFAAFFGRALLRPQYELRGTAGPGRR